MFDKQPNIYKTNFMENQDFTEIFNEINHISLNYSDLLSHFLEYVQEQKERLNSTFILENKKDNEPAFVFLPVLLACPAFLEAAVLSARQSVVIAMLSITLEKSFDMEQFKQLCLNCNCQGSKRYYIEQAFEDILKEEFFKNINISSSQDNLKKACFSLFTDFETETYSRILSKNKDLMSQTFLSKKTIEDRQSVFQLLINDKI